MAGAALLGVSVFGFLALNLVDSEPPPLLWTAADLPRVADGNGWREVVSDVPSIEVPESIMILQRDELSAQEFWAAAEAQGQQLHAFVTREDVGETLARFDRARSEALFVDDCMPSESCPVLAWHEIQSHVELRAVDHARSGQLAAAVGDLDDLMRMDVEHLASARTMISTLVALSQLSSVLHQVEMLASRDELDPQQVARLRRRVEAIDRDVLDLRRLVEYEYVWLTSLLIGEQAPPQVDMSSSAQLFYDLGQTLADLNARFSSRHEAAAAGDVAAAFGAGEPRPRESFGWWLHNPGGKLVIEATLIDPEISGRVDESMQEVLELRTRVLGQLER